MVGQPRWFPGAMAGSRPGALSARRFLEQTLESRSLGKLFSKRRGLKSGPTPSTSNHPSTITSAPSTSFCMRPCSPISISSRPPMNSKKLWRFCASTNLDGRKQFARMWGYGLGRKEPVRVFNFGTVAALAAEFVVLLVPFAEVRGTPGRLMPITASGAVSPVKAGIFLQPPSEKCFFFFAERARNGNQGRLASDAEFVCRQKKREAEDDLLIFCNGSYTEIDGQWVRGCERRITGFELHRGGRGNVVFASEPEAGLENPGWRSLVREPWFGNQ